MKEERTWEKVIKGDEDIKFMESIIDECNEELMKIFPEYDTKETREEIKRKIINGMKGWEISPQE